MNFDKISVSLYDLLGYLLPGFVLLMGGGVAEATFVKTHLLTLEGITGNPLPYGIVAYLLGQFCHALGSSMKQWCTTRARKIDKVAPHPKPIINWLLRTYQRVLEPCREGLSNEIKNEIEKELCKAYKIQPDQLKEGQSLTIYLLADHFVLASGTVTEREIYQAREGFFKASTIAFLALGLLFFASIFVGGAKINYTKSLTELMTCPLSGCLCFLCLWASSLSWRRHFFFSCLKKEHVKLLFLALRRIKDTEKTPTVPPNLNTP